MDASTARAELDLWPELPLEAWKETYATLHLWTQIVGKVRLALSPNINHWWGVPLYVNSFGLTTSAIPYADGNFEIQFDFFCGAPRYVALGMRSGYRCTRAVAQRHIIPIKGFAGTASVQRHASSVLGEPPRGSRRLRALWPSSLDRLRRKRL
jgi:hypothetical protein